MTSNWPSGRRISATMTIIAVASQAIRLMGYALIGLGLYSAIKTIMRTTRMLATTDVYMSGGAFVAIVGLTLLHIFFVAVSVQFAKRLFRIAEKGKCLTAIVRRGIRGQDIIPAMQATPVELVDEQFAALIRDHFGSQPGFYDRSDPVWHGASCLCNRCMANA